MMEEIEDVFTSATGYVRSVAGRLDSTTLLYLYSRFKQVNDGSCNTEKPGFFDFQGKQKWEAWKKLGSMTKEEAMQEYVQELTRVEPNWEEQIRDGTVKKSSGLGTAVSAMVNTDEDIPDCEKTLFDWVKEGEVTRVADLIKQDEAAVDQVDEEGMTALHWACDRGNVHMVDLLLTNSAQINAQDSEGQTALHYAVSCEHREVVELLLQRGADCHITDNTDALPQCDSADIKALLQQYS